MNTDTHRRRFATRNLAYIMQILQRTHTLTKFLKINNNHVQYKTECAPADGEATLSEFVLKKTLSTEGVYFQGLLSEARSQYISFCF